MWLIPDALKPVISLSDDNLPKVIIVATRTAIGAASDIIDAELNTKNFKIVEKGRSLPKKRSKCLTKNWVNSTKIKINRDNRNGDNSSLNIYRFNIFTC